MVASGFSDEKRFDGEQYWLKSSWKTKKDAQVSAELRRATGFKARVVKDGKIPGYPWQVYARRG